MKIKREIIMLMLAVVATITIIGVNAVQAYPTTDGFQSPLSSYQIDSNYFGKYLPSYNAYHAGDDLKATELTPVKSIANGKVVYSGFASGYATVVVIEHILPDNTKICSLYGHLSKTVTKDKDYRPIAGGKEVTKDQVIGYIGTDAENGEGLPHLHFAIKKGAYPGTFGTNFPGRVSKTGLNAFYNPSSYLNLIRSIGSPDVYKIDSSGKKAKVYSSNVFNSWGWNWSDIRPVTSSELNRYTNSNPNILGFKDGTFIKTQNNPEISKIYGGMRHAFGSWDAYIRYGGKSDLSNVMIVTNYEYNYLHTVGSVYR
jgi:hypothetical protein